MGKQLRRAARAWADRAQRRRGPGIFVATDFAGFGPTAIVDNFNPPLVA